MGGNGARHRLDPSSEDHEGLNVITCIRFLTVWLCAQARKSSDLRTKPNSEKTEGIFGAFLPRVAPFHPAHLYPKKRLLDVALALAHGIERRASSPRPSPPEVRRRGRRVGDQSAKRLGARSGAFGFRKRQQAARTPNASRGRLLKLTCMQAGCSKWALKMELTEESRG